MTNTNVPPPAALFLIILDSLLKNLWIPSYLTLSRQLQLAESSCAGRQKTCVWVKLVLGVCPWLVIYLKAGRHASKVWFTLGLTGLAQSAVMKHSVESFISEEPTDGGQWLSAVLVPLVDNLKDQSSPALCRAEPQSWHWFVQDLEHAGQEAGIYIQT